MIPLIRVFQHFQYSISPSLDTNFASTSTLTGNDNCVQKLASCHMVVPSQGEASSVAAASLLEKGIFLSQTMSLLSAARPHFAHWCATVQATSSSHRVGSHGIAPRDHH